MKQFEDVWNDVLGVVKKHPVIYTPETRKAQVITEITGDKIFFTDDATNKERIEPIGQQEFRWAWSKIMENGTVDDSDIRPLMGMKKMEFVWAVMSRLDYIEYENRNLRLK